jgi:hypothetical protein
VTDFLFRMVQKAAGWSSAAAAPQPPSQFHWPGPAMRPTLRGASSDASPRIGRSSFGLTPRVDSAEATGLKLDSDAMTRSDQPRADSFRTIETPASPSVPAADEGTGSSVVFNPSDEITLVRSQPPGGLEPLTTARPSESRRSAPAHRKNTAGAESQPFAIDFDHALASRTTNWPSEAADFSAQAQPVLPSWIEHAVPAMYETSEAMLPLPVRADSPAGPVPAAKQVPPRIARGQSRPQEPQPAVEVKIGSVEIVFDQPPVQAAQPAPVRPTGFAEFADLRRYVARPWPSRSR